MGIMMMLFMGMEVAGYDMTWTFGLRHDSLF
jgi:hypothetical protein